MRYEDRDKLVSSLRELADFIEERGLELPIDHYDVESLRITFLPFEDKHGTVKEKMRRAAKVLGSVEKHWSSNFLDLTKNFGCIALEFSASRREVCTKRVVGTTHVEELVIPAHEEDIVEWDCDPVLVA